MGAAGTGAGACSSRRGWVLLLLNARSTRGVYWGEGWEDPVSKQLVNRALRVVSNDSSIPMEELTDYFDWLYFEGSGGVGKVKGNEGYEAASLQSWVPRNDSVQHGHFMVYLMDDVVSNTSLDRPMEELFFSVSLSTHPTPNAVTDWPSCGSGWLHWLDPGH